MKDLCIICMPAEYNQTQGTIGNCSECNRELWISDTSLEAITEYKESKEIGKVIVVCVKCALPDILGDNNEILPFTASQIEELKNNIK